MTLWTRPLRSIVFVQNFDWGWLPAKGLGAMLMGRVQQSHRYSFSQGMGTADVERAEADRCESAELNPETVAGPSHDSGPPYEEHRRTRGELYKWLVVSPGFAAGFPAGFAPWLAAGSDWESRSPPAEHCEPLRWPAFPVIGSSFAGPLPQGRGWAHASQSGEKLQGRTTQKDSTPLALRRRKRQAEYRSA